MTGKVPTWKTYRYYWELIKFSSRYFITDTVTATVFWLSFTFSGLILRGFFNYLTGEEEFALPSAQSSHLRLCTR